MYNKMHKKTFVVVNPASSHGKTGERWERIKKGLLEEGLSFDYAHTRRPGEATGLCRDALERGYNTLISVGGDGTLNEVVNGFWGVEEHVRSQAALGLIATGTGGDFARTVNWPKNISLAVRRIMRGRVHRLDVGKITFLSHDGNPVERYFCNIADVGLGGFIINRSRDSSKALGGTFFFLLSTVGSLMLYRNKEIFAVFDEMSQWQGKVVMLVVGNGRFFGGGMKILPHASLDDGLLDILLITDMSKMKLLANLYRVYRGKHLHIKGVKFFRARKIKINSPQEVLLELDGEQPGKTPVEIEVLPRSLNFIV